MFFLFNLAISIITIIYIIKIQKKLLVYLLTLLFLLEIVSFFVILSANMQNHFGMKKVTKTYRIQMYSMDRRQQNIGILLRIPVKGGNSYVYRVDKDSPKSTIDVYKFGESYKVEYSHDRSAFKIIEKSQYEYKNEFWKKFFLYYNNSNKKSEVTVQYRIPYNWIELTRNQIQKLNALYTDVKNDKKTENYLKKIDYLDKQASFESGKAKVDLIKTILKIK